MTKHALVTLANKQVKSCYATELHILRHYFVFVKIFKDAKNRVQVYDHNGLLSITIHTPATCGKK